MEQELADINNLLADTSRLNLHDFLGRYPDYDDGVSLDSVIETDQSGSALSSNDAEHVLNSIDSSSTVVYDPDTTITPLTEPSPEADDRHTLIPDFDLANPLAPSLDSLTLDDGRPGSGASSTGSKESVFSKQKFKQTITHF